MEKTIFTNAQYCPPNDDGVTEMIKVEIRGQIVFVPTRDNPVYAEMMQQVDAGELTIAEAE